MHLGGGRVLTYDQLVIATGTSPRHDQTEGTLGPQWHKEVGEFYTYDGSVALRDQLDAFWRRALANYEAAVDESKETPQ